MRVAVRVTVLNCVLLTDIQSVLSTVRMVAILVFWSELILKLSWVLAFARQHRLAIPLVLKKIT